MGGYCGYMHGWMSKETWIHKTSHGQVHASPTPSRLQLDTILGSLLRCHELNRDSTHHCYQTNEIMICCRDEDVIRSLTRTYTKWTCEGAHMRGDSAEYKWIKSCIETSQFAINHRRDDADLRKLISRLTTKCTMFTLTKTKRSFNTAS